MNGYYSTRGWSLLALAAGTDRPTGVNFRDPAALRRWMSAYAAASSTTATFETIRDAASSGHETKLSRVATQAYRDALTGAIVPLACSESDTQSRLCVARLVLDHADPAAEDLGIEERAHQLLVRAVAQRLRFVTQRVGVLDGSLRSSPARRRATICSAAHW